MSNSSLTDKFIAVCTGLLPEQASIVVGVSAGSDSVALIALLHKLQHSLGITKLVIAHVNYGLRGADSDGDEAFVSALGSSLGIPVFEKRLHGHTTNEPGMELWAREERYRFFREVCRDNGCTLIATGHTLDDQAETVLMRMLRGSGLNGLRGIAPFRSDGVIRPLLTLQKKELLQWLDDEGISYRTDRSNSDVRLLRNRIRHEVLPQLEACQTHATEHLAALAAEAQGVWRQLEPLVNEWIIKHYRSVDTACFTLARRGFGEGNIAIEALRKIFEEHSITPDRFHLGQFSCGNNLHEGAMYLLPQAWYATVGRTSLYFEKKVPLFRKYVTIPGEYVCYGEGRRLLFSEEHSVPDELNAGPWTVYLDADTVGDTLVIRPVTEHDVLIPFGRKREISVHEFLGKQGMVKPDRDHILIVATTDNKPVWIHGIRLDDRFRVTSATKRVIKVQSSSIL